MTTEARRKRRSKKKFNDPRDLVTTGQFDSSHPLFYPYAIFFSVHFVPPW